MSKLANLEIGDIILLTKDSNLYRVSRVNKIINSRAIKVTMLKGFLNNDLEYYWCLHTDIEPKLDITFLFKPDPATPVHLQIQQFYPELSL